MAHEWIWQHPEWPAFQWDMAALAKPLGDARRAQGRLKMLRSLLDPRLTCEALAEVMRVEGLSTNAIEGENLNPASLAASVSRHRCETFKISNDPRFEEKLVDVVGLYLDPPEHAVVLSVDEKSQIQALDRTQPGLPLKKGRCGTMSHDCKRNGTTTLFAAMNTLDGTVIADTMPRHRHQEWLAFLKRLDRETPRHLDAAHHPRQLRHP